MKALSLTQPWATLVAIGAKRVETRSWATRFTGDVLIHAAKGFPEFARESCFDEPFRSTLRDAGIDRLSLLPRGAIIGVAHIQSCVPTQNVLDWIDERERAFGDYSAGRFAWVFAPGAAFRRLKEQVVCRGALGLWNLPADIEAMFADEVPA